MTPAGVESGRREGKLFAQLAAWAETDGAGLAFGSSAGFRMPDGSVLSPDASWVRRERWDALSRAAREGLGPLCPDAVFEVVSRNDDRAALRGKMEAYVANGAQMAVLIDPFDRVVEISGFAQRMRTLQGPDTVAFEAPLAGFVLNLKPICA